MPSTTAPLSKLIGSHAPGWLDAFEAQIDSLRARWPDAGVYALFDCAFNEPCHAEIKRSRLPARTLYDLSNDPSPELQAVSPTLVPLTRATAPSWRAVTGHTDGYPMLSVIVTPESLDELTLRLHPWCVVNADGEHYVFRFPDTRRLSGIVDVLTPEQHGAFFGPAHMWLTRTRRATWSALPLPGLPLPPAEEVKLDGEQFAQLMNDAEADEIIAHFHIHEPALVARCDPAEVWERMAHGLKRADYYSITHPDRLIWSRLFAQQPHFERIPEARPLLAALKSNQCGFREIEGPLTDLIERMAATY
jgi:hypothetical protein